MKIFAHLVSVFLHPLLMPVYAYFVILFLAPDLLPGLGKNQWRLGWFIFLITFLVPLVSIFFLFGLQSFFTRKKISVNETEPKSESVLIRSLLMENREERVAPFLMTTFFYTFITYVLLFKMSFALHLIGIIFLGITISLALVTIISVSWKISAHSVGIAGVAGVLTGLYVKYDQTYLFYAILVFMILAGVLMSARLYLNAHTPEQVKSGAFLGFLISLGTILFFA